MKKILIIICAIILLPPKPILAVNNTQSAQAITNAPSITATYGNITELKNSNPQVGTYVSTASFASPGDNGGGTYLITSSTETVDNMFIHSLNNGLKAKLVYADEINVAQVGILSDTTISDKLNALIKRSEVLGIKSIKFNDGNYILDKPIALKSLNYIGTGYSNLIVSNTFKTKDDKILYTYPDKAHPIFSLSITGINFNFPTSANHTLYDKEVILLSLQEIDGCTITNCNFNAFPDAQNGNYMKVDLVWFKHSSTINNIIINNCNFNNSTGKAYKGNGSDHLIGGCLWFCGAGNTINLPMNNISIANCNFYSTVSDESVGFWRGSYNNLTIDNCSFTNEYHDCDNTLSFFKGAFNDTKVSNSKFYVKTGITYLCKTTYLTGDSKVSFDNDSFFISSGITDTTKRQISLFYTGEDSPETNKNISATINIDDCTFKSSGNSRYRTLVVLSSANNKNYIIKKSSILLTLEQGVFILDGHNSAVKVSSSDINTNSYLFTSKKAKKCSIAISNNTIHNKIDGTFNGRTDVAYNFTKNTCTSRNNNVLCVCNDLSAKDSIQLKEAKNKFLSHSKVEDFKTNNKISSTDVLVQY